MADMKYEVTRALVGPVSNALEAVIALNWWVEEARRSGWVIELSIEDESGQVSPVVRRVDAWPAPAGEA